MSSTVIGKPSPDGRFCFVAVDVLANIYWYVYVNVC